MAEEEEIRYEIEAVQAVYGEYCHVISDYPPHLTVHIAPRTAEDSSQQFVEVTLGLKADVEYPKKPPYIYILEMKGLDENRREIMITRLSNKARELSSCLMLVALCEEAVESLSTMNHPDGDCPLCLYPLVAEDKSGLALPFMKLMSCYHCFHSECIIRFWNWLQEQNGINVADQADDGMQVNGNCQKANCPACRKEFNEKDMEHVLDYLGTSSFQLQNSSAAETDEEAKALLQSVSENKRRENFDSILKIQQENSGLNEPKKNLAILPGMYLPKNSGLNEPKKNLAILPGMHLPENSEKPSTSSETSNEQCDDGVVNAEPEKSSEILSKEANTNKQINPNSRRKPRYYNSKRPTNSQANRKQWVRKDP